MRSRFDVVTIPRNITVNDLCLAFVLNLVGTSDTSFETYFLTTNLMENSECECIVLVS